MFVFELNQLAAFQAFEITQTHQIKGGTDESDTTEIIGSEDVAEV